MPVVFESFAACLSQGSQSFFYLVDPGVSPLFSGKVSEDDYLLLPESGEKLKSLAYIELIAQQLLRRGIDRSSTVVGVGGGAVTDFVGFLGGIYLRGINVGLVPTTLLAQVDASVGGKCGVNLGESKNILGVIAEPAWTLIDPSLTKTQTAEDFLSGMAEVVKIAALSDEVFFSWLQSNIKSITAREDQAVLFLVKESVRLKQHIVTRDPNELGERRLLNLGHTVAHAIERKAGVRHGEAVAIGLALEGALAVKLHHTPASAHQAIVELLAGFSLPTSIPQGVPLTTEAIMRDKKKMKDILLFPYVTKLGGSAIAELPILEFCAGVQAVG